jgi:broad specificity phosphatase PhoE
MPKKMKFERQAARQARNASSGPSQFGSIPPATIPHEAVTDAPDPLTSAAMAAGGLPVVRGNSNKTPLTPKGDATVAKTGAALAALGGPDQIVSSPATRTMETAAAIQGADPKRPPVTAEPGLESQALGNLEGEPKTPAVRKFLADLVRKNPDYRIPGQGAMSSRPGESMNEFRVRALSAVRGIMQALAQNPHQAIAVPKHNQVSRLVKGWIAKGMPDDLSIDDKAFLGDDNPKPGEVEKLAPNPDGSWGLNKFDPEKETSMPKGAIYMIEHGETPNTAAKSGKVSAGQKARAELIMAIRSLDWKKAKAVAMKASSEGVLSDAEIEQAIDDALPSMDDIQSMTPDKLLPVVSAAGPEKRAQMLPVLKQKFGDMAGASPDAVHRIKAHLGRLVA